LGKTPVGDAKHGYAGARRGCGKETRDRVDILLELLLLVRTFDCDRLGEVDGNDKVETVCCISARGDKECNAENKDREFDERAAGQTVRESPVEVAPEFVLEDG
jgi:hypothetical protein